MSATNPDTACKLHPISIPYRIMQNLPGVLVLAFVVVFMIGELEGGLATPVGGIVILIGIIGICGWQIAYYKRFRYELTHDTFDIRSGVISRRNREIPYRRIQNVDISRSLLQRVIGVAELRLETAGGGQSEAHLRYVGYDEAKRLQEEVRSRTRGIERGEIDLDRGERDDGGIPTLLYQISDRDLAILAIASFDLRVLSVLVVGLTFVAPGVLIDLITVIPIEPVAIILAVLLIVVISSAILSGTSAIINNWGFELSRIGDELRYERGLLQRYDGSIPLDKVQTLVILENVIMRYFKYASLKIETAGYAPGQGAAESARAVPISDRETTFAIAKDVEDFGDDYTFSRPAVQARIRYAWQYSLMLGIVVAIAYAVNWGTEFAFRWWLLLTLAILIPFAAHFKWKHRGYAITRHHILMRTGFWRRQTHIVPYYRIQNVDFVQSILQRRWGIATVVIDTAGSSGLIAGDPIAFDIHEEEATLLQNRLAQELQSSLRIRERRRRVLDVESPRRESQGIRGSW